MVEHADRTIGAVDIGATKTLVTAVPASLTEWPRRPELRRFPTPADPEELVRRIADALRELSRKVDVICVAAPGPLDFQAGVIVHSPNQAWHDVPLGALLASATGATVRLEDDANLGALGEAVLGAGRECSSVVYVTVSTGIGAGIVIDGRIVRGAHGLAGEVGHLVVDPRGPQCGCGGKGHVEAFAGGAGIARRARRLPELGVTPGGVHAVFAAAERGDLRARRIVDDAANALGLALASLAAALDPQRLVVGGSVALRQPKLVVAAAEQARRRLMAEAGEVFEVTAPALGESCVVAGAAALGVISGRH